MGGAIKRPPFAMRSRTCCRYFASYTGHRPEPDGTSTGVRHRRLPGFSREPLRIRGLLVIDGFEQLGFLTRLRLKRRGGGLLVSSHRSVGLPTLFRTDVTAGSATAVIARLVPPGGEWVLDGYDLSPRLAALRGSLRAVLFELYDRWEAGGRKCSRDATRSIIDADHAT